MLEFAIIVMIPAIFTGVADDNYLFKCNIHGCLCCKNICI